MFGWFRKKEAIPLVFPDNHAAFEYACSYLPNRILLEAVLPAIVEDEGDCGHDGERVFRIRLAGPVGGRDLWAASLVEATDWPEIGDQVGFRIVTIAEDITPEGLPVGYIACVFAPVQAGRKGWKIARNLPPANIKQALRY
jgi:hypothetical protein